MTPQIKKWIIKPLLILVGTFVVLNVVAILVLFAEQEKLVQMAVERINKQYRGELTVGSSEVSVFKHFPSIGFSIQQVYFFPDETRAGGPIFRFERLYVGVRPLDLISRNHAIRRLSFHGGNLDLVREEDGTINLFKAFISADSTAETTSDSSGRRSLMVDLQKIAIKGLDVSYFDRASSRGIATHINELSSNFTVDSSRMTIALTNDMIVNLTNGADTSFFSHKKVQLDVVADYKPRERLVELTKGNVKLQDAAFSIDGTADFSDRPNLNLRFKGDEPDFKMLAAFLPGDVKTILKPFRYEGHVFFDGTVQGDVSKGHSPLVQVSFGCKDAWFLNEAENEKVDKLEFTGSYTNGSEQSLRTSELQIMNVNARPGKGIFKGNFVLRDFRDPQILMQLQSELELGFLGDFFGLRHLKQSTGKIKLDMDFSEIIDLNLPENSIGKLKEGIQSKLTVEDLSFRIPGYPHAVKNVNLHAVMNKGRLILDSAKFRIGGSDLKTSGSISDIQGFIHDPHKPIVLTLDATSENLLLKELLAHDTVLARRFDEEIHKFNVGLTLETSVAQLLHPSPLPLGKFDVRNLNASFKNYAHKLKNLDATVQIEDSTLMVINFTGMIDSSDMKLSGRVHNYQLWFNDLKKGRTEIAFDFKAKRFALMDVFTRESRRLLPRGYRREQLNDAWLSARVNMRYDTIFRFARAEITNVTGQLKRHKLQFKDVKGRVRYGASILGMDTLKGTLGKSDFDLNMRYYTGTDPVRKKKTNFLRFRSASLDLDEITSYDFSTPPRRIRVGDSLVTVVTPPDTSAHAKSFNIFTIPFSDFNLQVDIGKFKYNKLWIKDINARVRMTEDHQLHIDTISMKIARGTVGMKGLLDGRDTSKIYFTSALTVNQVDLEKVGLKLDNFGQDVMINKNIKGRLSGTIDCKVQVHPNLVPLAGNSTARLDIQIFDGSLVDFAPMQAMAGYFKDKNLKLVRFDTLTNELKFTNGVLEIPSMDINSSLGAIQVSGKQSIDLRMEYYVRVPMKLVTQVGFSALFDKKDGEEVDPKQIDQIVHVDKKRKGMYVNLKVVGTPTDYKVSLGKNRTGS